MGTLAKMDEKGRVQIPTKIRKLLKLKSKQLIFIEVKDDTALIRKAAKPDVSSDKVLRDIFVRPGHSKVRLTAEMLNSLKDEVWTP